jgi:hypothetical protein
VNYIFRVFNILAKKAKIKYHQNNHLYGKIGFFFLDFNTDFCHYWEVELHKLFIFYPCKTDYCFIKSVTWNGKEIAPLVKWSLRLPYTFLVHLDQRSMWTIAITWRPSSVVCRLSSVNFSHFKLLLRNHLADWNRT